MAKVVQTDFLVELGIRVVRRPKSQKLRCGETSVSRTVQISTTILARYAGLEDIAPHEWLSYFPNTGKPWNTEDREYLVQWWGKDDVLSLAYALGRPPWGLQREVCRLRKVGVEIEYQRRDG